MEENNDGLTGDCGCEIVTETGLPLKTQPFVSVITHEYVPAESPVAICVI